MTMKEGTIGWPAVTGGSGEKKKFVSWNKGGGEGAKCHPRAEQSGGTAEVKFADSEKAAVWEGSLGLESGEVSFR